MSEVAEKKVVSGEGSDPVGAATKAAKATVSGARKKRGRPTKAELRAEEEARAKALAAELDRLFDPENFRYIVRAPADTALAVTGDELWVLDEGEVEALATQAASTSRHFVNTDPKWVSLIMLSMSIMTVYGSRAALYYRKKREEKAQRVPEAVRRWGEDGG